MKKLGFILLLFTIFTTLSISISASAYANALSEYSSSQSLFNGETDTLYYLPDSAKFIDKYAIAGEIYSRHTRFSPKEGWDYYKVKEIQFLFSSMVIGDTLKQISFYKDTLTNLVYRQNINVLLDSSMVYPQWYSITLSNEFPVVSGVIEVPLPMNNLFSLCIPTNATASGNTIGFFEAFQGWGKTGDMPIKLVIEKSDSTPPAKTIQVTFSVNMELERLSGLFNPASDTVSIGGNFNAWGKTNMTVSQSNSDIYNTTVSITSSVQDTIRFNFFHSPNTWETVGVREFFITQSDYDSGVTLLDAIGFNAEIPVYPRARNVTFICNTNGATIVNAPAGTEFKTIHMAGRNSPLQWPSGGWPNDDSTKMIQLYDDGTHNDAVAGDKIFTTEITFPQYYSTLNITYKYSANWGLSTNGGGNDNELVTGSNHTLQLVNSKVYYVVNDTFGIAKNHDFTEVEKIRNTIPSAYKLKQNYPNPFNPETVISWQLAAGSFVTLKIYDVLGNEVATLVNEEHPAGTYQITFDAQLTTNHQQLTSSVYFYQLRAGNFVQTKKMILLR